MALVIIATASFSLLVPIGIWLWRKSSVSVSRPGLDSHSGTQSLEPPPWVLVRMQQGRVVIGFEKTHSFPQEYLVFFGDHLEEVVLQLAGKWLFGPLDVEGTDYCRQFTPDVEVEPCVEGAFAFEIFEKFTHSLPNATCEVFEQWNRKYTVLKQDGRIHSVGRVMRYVAQPARGSKRQELQFLGLAMPLEGFSCAGCGQFHSPAEVHLLPWWSGKEFCAVYRCDQCWQTTMSETRAALANPSRRIQNAFVEWMATWFEDESIAAPWRDMPLDELAVRSSLILDQLLEKGGLYLEESQSASPVDRQ